MADPVAHGGGGRVAAVATRPLLLAPAIALVGFAVLYPLVFIVQQSFAKDPSGLNGYQWVFDNPVYLKIIGRTITTAVFVTLICLVAGYPLAYLIASSTGRRRQVLLVLAILPFWTSMLVRVFAWLILFQPSGIVDTVLRPIGLDGDLLGTAWAPRVAMAQLLLPFMVLPLVANMQGIDQRLVTAARSLGAPPREAFIRIFLPLSLPGVAAGSLIVFILSLGFYLAPALLGSPSDSMLAQSIYQQVGSLLNFGRGGALGALLLGVALAVLAIGLALRARVARPRRRAAE